MAYPKPPRTSAEELDHKILVGARQGTLRLQSVELKRIPDRVWNLQDSEKITVKEIYLEDNLLKELPPGIGDFVKLYELKLDRNQLVTLPATISRLTSLQLLFLRRNRIKELPGEIGGCMAMTVLWLTSNPLAALPVEFGGLTNLKDLNIDDTPNLRYPPTEVRHKGLKAMQRFLLPFHLARETARLQVVEAGLHEMPNVGFLQGLTSLRMLSNKIPFLGPGVVRCYELRDVVLSDNLFEHFPTELCCLRNLTHLDLSFNRLEVTKAHCALYPPFEITSTSHSFTLRLEFRCRRRDSFTRSLFGSFSHLLFCPSIIHQGSIHRVRRQSFHPPTHPTIPRLPLCLSLHAVE
jgi:Leucine-rich repeat (LRR) protein